MRKDKHISVVDAAIRYLGGHRREAVEALFATATQDYKDEWMKRDVFRFWCALDLSNQRRLVELACQHYEVGSY